MASFIADKIVMDGLTYDDVLLVPAYSEVLPRTVHLGTRFSRHIELKIPFVTAAMDTVTESTMAIAIAREGGIGVIHKNMSIEEQARQVAIVKRAENGMIYDPVTIKLGRTVQDALNLMHEYHIGGIPVVDDDRRLVGIVTNRDLRFERNVGRPIDEVMTSENLVTTHVQTDLVAAAQILQEYKIEKLPVVDDNGRLIGLITYKDITKAKDKPMACKDEKGRLRVAAGVGVTADKYVEMNVCHPFMEGNGRTTRIWLDLMLKARLQRCVDWSKINKNDYLQAMTLSVADATRIKALLHGALTDRINDREMFMKGIDYSYYYEQED